MTPLSWTFFKVGHCHQIERLTRKAAPWRICEFPATAALITHPEHGHILFDTGYSQEFFKQTRRFPERAQALATPVTLQPNGSLKSQLANRAIKPQDIATLILSHFHADHIAGLSDFPHSRIICSKPGWNEIKSISRFKGVRHGLLPGLLPDDFPQRADFFEDKAILPLPAELAPFTHGYDLLGDASIIAIALPGHAVGQHGILFTQTDGRAVFLIADAAWSTRAVNDYDLPMKIAQTLVHHSPEYPVTLRRLHDLHKSNNDILIIPCHCRDMLAKLTGDMQHA